jgi:hypothetical protein
MHPVNLAFQAPAGSWWLIGGVVRWIVWVVRENPMTGIPVAILLIGVLIVVSVRIVRKWRASKRLAGTAQVLSVETMTTTEGPDPSHTCRIALRVEIPGRPPYDATSSNGEFMTPVEMAAVQPGKTVAVQISSTDPQDVWIDFSAIA